MTDLLRPISASDPCGEDFTFSTEFDEIQELRREDDPTLDQGEWVTTLKTADWPAVVKRCDTLLSERTKDLRLLVWRVEALAQVKGYAGLAKGLEDCAGVCSAYWEAMHPLPEDGDVEQRAGAVRWLLSQVQKLARAMPVTQGAAGRYSLADFEDARQLQQAMERDPDQAAAMAQGKPAPNQVQKAKRSTPPSVWVENINALAAARTHLKALQDQLDPALGDHAPSFVHARQALEDASHALERLGREAGAIQGPAEESTEAPQPEAGGDASPAGGGVVVAAASGELRTRSQALAQLRAVAEFFRRTEPHSPVAFLADKAARWGDMPLHDWLREVIKDNGSLSHLEELLGVQPPSDEH